MSTFIGALIHVALVLVLYQWLGWGIAGIAWATSMHFLARCMMNWMFVTYDPHWQQFDDLYFFSYETVTNLGPQVKICLQATAMLVWGWWAFEILAFMASYISPEALAAQSCMRAIGLFTFMIPSGFSRSAAALIGNAAGAGNSALCIQYYKTSLAVVTGMAVVTAGVLWIFELQLINIFTNMDEVKAYIFPAWWAYILYVLVDAA